jgi:hypothetical protein
MKKTRYLELSMALAVECLSTKHETLSSNPSTAKKKKKKRKKKKEKETRQTWVQILNLPFTRLDKL